jgi:hypothetical protein
MERSLSSRNPREIRGCEATDCRESSVKKCHAISRVMKMTPDTRHYGSVSREGGNNTFRRATADGK